MKLTTGGAGLDGGIKLSDLMLISSRTLSSY
jgi:hypothetical protein